MMVSLCIEDNSGRMIEIWRGQSNRLDSTLDELLGANPILLISKVDEI